MINFVSSRLAQGINQQSELIYREKHINHEENRKIHNKLVRIQIEGRQLQIF